MSAEKEALRYYQAKHRLSVLLKNDIEAVYDIVRKSMHKIIYAEETEVIYMNMANQLEREIEKLEKKNAQ